MQVGGRNERMVDSCTTVSNERISYKGQLTLVTDPRVLGQIENKDVPIRLSLSV